MAYGLGERDAREKNGGNCECDLMH
jgi:hypothetical protein